MREKRYTKKGDKPMGCYKFVKQANERYLQERLRLNPDLVSRKQVLEIVDEFLLEHFLDEGCQADQEFREKIKNL